MDFKFWFILFIPLGKFSAVREKARIFELGSNYYESGPLFRVVSMDQIPLFPGSPAQLWNPGLLATLRASQPVSPNHRLQRRPLASPKWMWDPTVSQELEKPHWRVCEVEAIGEGDASPGRKPGVNQPEVWQGR